MPLANTEGGLSISLYRGAKAAAESGGFRTHVLGDRVTRASAFLFDTVASACVAPPGMGHLEDPALTGDLTLARDGAGT